jgi:hypothetical protein
MHETPGQSPPLPDRIRLPLSFDPVRLLDDLDAIAAADWIDHFVKQNYDGAWTVLPLRKPVGATHPVMMIYSDPTAHAFDDAPMLGRTSYLRDVLAGFDCPIQTARLMRLAPGSRILEHSDHDLAAENGVARIHVPISTNPQVEFLLNREAVVMGSGSAWYLRLADPHSVTNNGTTDRIHLVFDCVVNDWLSDMLHAAVQTKQPSSTCAGSTG